MEVLERVGISTGSKCVQVNSQICLDVPGSGLDEWRRGSGVVEHDLVAHVVRQDVVIL